MNSSRVVAKPYVWILGGILLVAAILRMYQFEPWLHFELDQARDMLVVEQAFEGDVLDLPLLGPRAAGSFLRLAPGFYYLQYFSGLLFGADPAGVAFFVPILSLLAVFVFYLLARRAFSRSWSLGLTATVAVSTYLVLYGRFSWNPNLLVFFVPLGLYALLRAVDPEEPKAPHWFLGATAALVFATHFHFLAFLSLPIIVGAFLLYKRPRFTWKVWLGAAAIAVFLYLPMILNETKAGFTNTQAFFGTVSEKEEKSDHNIIEKAVRNFNEYALAGIVVTTGFEGAALPAIILQPDEIGSVCRDRCDDGKWYGIAGALVLLLGMGALGYQAWYTKPGRRKDFYVMTIVWFGVSFLIFLPFAYDVAPRFYLLTAPIFFFALGALLLTLRAKIGRPQGNVLFWIVIGLLIVSNSYFTWARFQELNRATTEAVDSAPDRILKEQVRVTLEQQDMVARFFEGRQRATGYPIYLHSDPQYRRALKYMLDSRGVQNDVLSLTNIYKEGEYYLVLRHRNDYEANIRKYRENYDIGEYRPLGTLMIIQLIPKPEKIGAERQDFSSPEEKNGTPKEAPRYTWREFFAADGKALQEESPEEGEDTE